MFRNARCGFPKFSLRSIFKRFRTLSNLERGYPRAFGVDSTPISPREFAALETIGTKGDKNGFHVGFGETGTGGAIKVQGKHIQVDWKAVNAGLAQATKAGLKPVAEVEDASGIGHETTHLGQREPAHWAQNQWDLDELNEREAYRVSSAMSQAGHSDSIYGVWNESWANSADRETIRQEAVKEMGHESMEASREDWYATGHK